MPEGLCGFQKGHPSYLTEESHRKMKEAATGERNHNFGKKLSKKHKKKIGDSNRGKKKPPVTEKTRKKMSEKKMGEKNYNFGKTGEKHHNYIIDRNKLKTDRLKAYDTKYKYWMRNVKNRDNWKCRINNKDCKGKLEAHHILSWLRFPKLRYNINNGISLCQFHHPRKRKDEIKLVPIFQKIVSTKA